MTELKSCPFCGGVAKLMHGPDNWVECTRCHASSSMHTMIVIAIKEWNRRVKE